MSKAGDQAINAVLRVVFDPTVKNQATNPFQSSTNLKTTTTATSLTACGVGWRWSHILDSANLHPGTGEGAESGLGSWAWGLGSVTSSGTDLDVQSIDAQFLAADSDILSSQHGSVGRGLVTVCLDLHAAGDTSDGFAAREIGDVDEGIIKRRKYSCNSENKLPVSDLRAEGDVLLGGACGLLWRHGVELFAGNQIRKGS